MSKISTHKNPKRKMPFLLSVPKKPASATTTTNSALPLLQHRKVTIDSVTNEGVTFDMKEFLLASGAEPKDILPAFGFESFVDLMRLGGIWDVIETMYEHDPTTFEDCNDEPLLKLIQHLLVNKIHPTALCNLSQAQTIKNLLEMQLEWLDIKENYKVAELACDFCGGGGCVLRCSGCMAIRKEVRYCNKECQNAGWKKHKKDGCGRFASEEAKSRVKQACERAKKAAVLLPH
jgi:hypothetical protein